MNDVTRRKALKFAAAGLGTIAGGSLLAADQNNDPQHAMKDRWRAWAVTKGQHAKLVVEGIYSQGGPGLVAIVQEAVPQGINPKILMLKVQIAKLPGVWPAVLQPIPAQYAKTPYRKGQYTSIHLLYPNGESIMIDEITDTGTGPK